MHAWIRPKRREHMMHKHFLPALTALITVLGVTVFFLWPKADAEVSQIPASPVQRCMNLSNALEAPTEGLWGYTIREADLIRLKKQGFDTVRMPVRWQLIDTPNGLEISPAQLRRVDEVLLQAKAAGLQVILNAHHYNELNEDPDTHEPRLEVIWQQLASRYANAPKELIFELINEPYSGMTIKRTDALNQRLLSIVRASNPDRWVLYGTAHWGTLEGMLKSKPGFDPKAMIGFHYYDPFEFTHQGATFVDPPPPTGVRWGSAQDRKTLAADFAKAAQFRDRAGMPLILGEFGVYADVPITLRADWTGTARAEAEAAGFGWCHWGFASAFKSYDQDLEDWLYPMLRALIP